jgi:outer membrane protein assembly factor BamB
MIACTLFCLAAVAFRSAALSQENWPEFRGPLANGHAVAAKPPVEWSEEKNVRWKTAIHDRGWSSPVIWDNQIWMTTATPDGHRMYAVCVDRETGKVLHDKLLFENDEPREIHSLNSYASPTPVIEAGRVYVHFGSYGTACLDASTGKTLWTRRDLPCNHYRGPGSSPIPFGDKLIIHYDGFDHQYIVALNKETGETIWKRDRDVEYGSSNGDFKKAYCTPLVIQAGGRTQLISPTSKAAISYDPATGDEFWRIRYPQFSATARPLFDGELLYINTGFGKAELHAVRPDGEGDVTESHVAWIEKKSVPSKTSQLLVDGLLHLIGDDGVATCLEAKTGTKIWQKRVGGKFSASPIFAGGHIYLSDHDGTTRVLRPGREYDQVAECRLAAGCMASPAVAGDAIYLRTKTHLYRLEK